VSAADPALLGECQQFEAFLLRPLLDHLHFGRVALLGSRDADDAVAHSSADDLMGSLFADALSLALVRADGLGVARELARALSGLKL
jgi:hypothetical protein